MYTVSDIIDALGKHSDESAIGVLEEVGTNSSNNEIRKMTAKALIERNTHNALRVLLINKGKGIHDYNEDVSSSVVEMLKNIEDNAETLRILEDTINFHSDEEVRAKSRFVRDQILSSKSPFSSASLNSKSLSFSFK